MGIVVQKFGGSSVADVERIRKKLEIAGVGYRASKQGSDLEVPSALAQGACQPDPVELVVDPAERLGVVGKERDHPWNCAGGRERLDVALAHGPRRRKISWNPAKALQALRGDSDYGAFGHGMRIKTALCASGEKIHPR